MQSIFIGPETNINAVQKVLSIDFVFKKFQNHLTLFLPVFVSVAPPQLAESGLVGISRS